MREVVLKSRNEEAVYRALRAMDTEEIQRRLDAGRMTPMAVSAARSELERRGETQAARLLADSLPERGSVSAPSRQVESLSATYRQMNRDDILRELDSGELSPTAASVARGELDRREKVVASMVAGPPARERPDNPNNPYAVAALIITGLLMLAYAAVMMRDSFLLVLLIVLPIFAAVFGKAFPLLGLILGAFFVTTPIWLTVLMWKDLAWQSGDFKPLGAIVGWFFLFVGSAIGIALGAGFLKGALHKGSWGSLARDVEQDRLENIDDLLKRKRRPW